MSGLKLINICLVVIINIIYINHFENAKYTNSSYNNFLLYYTIYYYIIFLWFLRDKQLRFLMRNWVLQLLSNSIMTQLSVCFSLLLVTPFNFSIKDNFFYSLLIWWKISVRSKIFYQKDERIASIVDFNFLSI